MSIKLMSLVWELDLPDSEKILLLALCDRADDDGRCWPSVKTLAAKCSKSERTVQTALRSLGEKGYLKREDRPGKSTIWTVNPRDGCTPAEIAPVQPATLTPATAAPNTSVYTKVSKDARATWPDWLPQSEWIAFLEMRKKIKAPLTEDGARLAIGKLEKLAKQGHPAADVLNQSVMLDWRGLFELRDGATLAPASERADDLSFAKQGEAADAAKFRAAIAERVGAKTYRSWIDRIDVRVDGDRVALVAASSVAADHIRNNLGGHIQGAAKALFAGSREVIILAATPGRRAA